MFDKLVKKTVLLKQEFRKSYSGNAHIQEIIPLSVSEEFPIDAEHLSSLHNFMQKNVIYSNYYEEKILDIPCLVYEGDINDYWLNSIKHGSSCQPFYPTWMLSAYLLGLVSKNLGFTEMVDIGSGDGRIAFCGSIVGLDAHSVEIDDVLVNLQKTIVSSTGENFDPHCEDALMLDYSKFQLEKPVFLIGGLSQMGGDVLANSIIEKIHNIVNLTKNTGLVLTGTNSKRHLSNNDKNGGWDSFITQHNLSILETVSLPTVWTFDQMVETPYLFTKFT